MSTATETTRPDCPVVPHETGLQDWQAWRVALWSRLQDYAEMARPGIALMVLTTVTVGFVLGQRGDAELRTLLAACCGIALATAGASAVNQWMERKSDARMARTGSRPLPDGRLYPAEVLALGTAEATIGCAILATQVNVLTAVLTASTFILYALVYTPLKRRTAFCTTIGAIPGALPIVLGWTAAGRPLDLSAFALFGILFFWQFPHFLAIAWLHREDYLAAGLKMLPGGRPLPGVTGLIATVYALGLIPISLVPSWFGLAGPLYACVAVILGMAYVAASLLFARYESTQSGRHLLRMSFVYLPVVLGVLAFDHWRLLWLPIGF